MLKERLPSHHVGYKEERNPLPQGKNSTAFVERGPRQSPRPALRKGTAAMATVNHLFRAGDRVCECLFWSVD